MLDRKKLEELVESLEIVEMKIKDAKTMLDNLENIKRMLEIDFEEGLYDWPDEILMKG